MATRQLISRSSRYVRKAASRLGNRFGSETLVLMYHRVADLRSDPQQLSVTPCHFAEHLEVLQSHCRPVRLRDIYANGRRRQDTRTAVTLTFDDGYADNLYNAKPLLERFDVPATVFVATGYTGGQLEFWWDELERLLLMPGMVPRVLRLVVSGKSYEWDLDGSAEYSEAIYERERSWITADNDDPSSRQRIYRSLHQLLRPLRDRERRDILDRLRSWAGAQRNARPTHRPLSAEEIVQLKDGGLVEIGAHTVSHPVLSSLDPMEQREEILASKTRLEDISGTAVTCFSYPYGTVSDYTQETVRIVRQGGFGCACSNFPGVVRWKRNRFELPRFVIRDWDGEAFTKRLQAFLHE